MNRRRLEITGANLSQVKSSASHTDKPNRNLTQDNNIIGTKKKYRSLKKLRSTFGHLKFLKILCRIQFGLADFGKVRFGWFSFSLVGFGLVGFGLV